MSSPKFLTKYDHADVVSPSGDVSMTDQQYLKECDIDLILKRYRAGEPLPVNTREGRFGDFSEVGEFADCMRRVNNAVADFEALPAAVRARFGNEPLAFYQFALNPSNREECVKMGIAKELPPADVKDVVTAPAAEPAPNGEGGAKNT